MSSTPPAGPPPLIVPILLCARIATLARVEGRLSGARADAVYGARLAWTGADPRVDPAAAGACARLLDEHLGFAFARSLGSHMRLEHPDAFSLLMERVDKDMAGYAMAHSGARAFPHFLCANPDERVWGLGTLDDRHWSFGSQAAARLALERALEAGVAGLTRAGAPIGLSLLPGPALRIESETRFDCAPSMPAIPLTSISGGGWGQNSHLWGPLTDRLLCAIEAAELASSSPEPARAPPGPRRAL